MDHECIINISSQVSNISIYELYYAQAIRAGSSILHMLTRNKRYLAGSVFQFMNGLVCVRLGWMLENNETLKQAAGEGVAAMGTIDSFILHRYSTLSSS